MRPQTTRLRFARSKRPEALSKWLDALGMRIQIYGQPVWDGKKWVMWFVPGDLSPDIPSVDLDEMRPI